MGQDCNLSLSTRFLDLQGRFCFVQNAAFYGNRYTFIVAEVNNGPSCCERTGCLARTRIEAVLHITRTVLTNHGAAAVRQDDYRQRISVEVREAARLL